MILAISIQNTETSFGFYEGDSICHHCIISSISQKTADEYVMFLNDLCAQKEIDKSKIEGAVIASVVPPITEKLKQAVEIVFHCNPLIVAHGIKTGLNIRIDNHTQLGADIVANTVAAAGKLEKPFAVIELGSATTISAVNKQGELFGVIIIPGVKLSLDALSNSAAELPDISLEKPKSLLGKNTIDSMLSGSVYGTAAMLDGIISRLKEELKSDDLNVIACGGLAEKIIPYCKTEIKANKYLTLEGLLQLYKLNQKKPNQI